MASKQRFPMNRWYTGDAPTRMRVHRATCRPGGAIPGHHHDYYELFWIEQGSGRQQINGRNMTLSARELVFMRPQDGHNFEAIESPWSWVNISMSAATHDALQARYRGELPQWPWAHRRKMPMQMTLSPNQLGRLKELAASVPVTHFPDTSFHRWTDVDWLLGGVLRIVFPTEEELREADAPPWLAAIVQQLRDDHGAGWDAGIVAEETGFTRDHLSRSFRRHFGMTTTQYLQHLRLNYAAKELRTTSKPITVIAEEAGYDNLSYFHRSFRKHLGVTPRHFRLRGRRPA